MSERWSSACSQSARHFTSCDKNLDTEPTHTDSPFAVFRANNDGTVIHANPAW
jgi:hypothetical protein